MNCACNCTELVLRIIDKILDHPHDHHHHGDDKHHNWEKGEIHLTTGRHEVLVQTKHQPEHVFLCHHACHQICGANIDFFSSQITDKGFVLLAEVENDHVKVDWLVKFKCHEDNCCS